MKFFKYLPFALAIAAMVGCSDDNFVEVPDNGILEDGGYVNVVLHLPSVSGKTRLTESFNDGLASEYIVTNGTLVLFDDAKNIIVAQSYTDTELGFSLNGTATDNITSSSTKIMIPGNAKTPKYILALLNINGEMSSRITAVTASTPSITKYDDLKTVIDETSAISIKGHFMSNSSFDNTNAASVYKEGTSGLQELQMIDPKLIALSQTAVLSAVTNVYVERASVKVDLAFGLGNQGNNTNSTYPSSVTALPFNITFSTGDVLTITGWTLTVTNNSYYPIKNLMPTTGTTWSDWLKTDDYFMGNDINGSSNYRSYWAADPDYATGPTSTTSITGYYDNFTYATLPQADNNIANPLYCLENTFTAARQEQNQTTSVLIAGKFAVSGAAIGDDDVYTMSGSIFSGTQFIEELVKKLDMLGYKAGTNALSTNNFELVPTDYIYKHLVKYVSTASDNLVNGSGTIIDLGVTGYDEAVNNIEEMDKILNSFGTRSVAYYKGGLCYYTIPIRHFDNNEVPLYDSSTADGYAIPSTGKIGGVNKEHQEGRYGVVRNHWYSVNVSSIKSIGRPAPPTDEPINPDPSFPDPLDPVPGTPTPDDVENRFIEAQIHVLPWARRSQDADI